MSLNPPSCDCIAEVNAKLAEAHKLELSRRGAQSGFWHGVCQCGWGYPGAFATRQRTVRDAYERHVAKATGSAA